jgi:formyltetrahydrofolate-dependent phosphoribosylglycinamide formyltransferase
MSKLPINLAVFCSGQGTTLKNLIYHCNQGMLKDLAQITDVICNCDCPAAKVATFHHIRCQIFHKETITREQWDNWMELSVCWPPRPHLLILCGWTERMKILPKWENKILNLHPTLLPKFKGIHGDEIHQIVIDAGEKVSGSTVHVVTEELNEGQILGQIEVPVEPWDTQEALKARVQDAERKLYPQVIADFIKENRDKLSPHCDAKYYVDEEESDPHIPPQKICPSCKRPLDSQEARKDHPLL